MNKEKLQLILGREEFTELIDGINQLAHFYADERILITGGNNPLGQQLANWFESKNITNYFLTDTYLVNNQYPIFFLDVTSPEQIWEINKKMSPTIVFHLATICADESDSAYVANVNIGGTENVCMGFPDARIVLESTGDVACADSVYGASCLIAERIVLTYNGNIARCFDIAENYNFNNELFADDCYKYFISLDEAVSLLLYAGSQASGRFMIDAQKRQYIPDLLVALNKEDPLIVRRLRGQKYSVPLHAGNEKILNEYRGIARVTSDND